MFNILIGGIPPLSAVLFERSAELMKSRMEIQPEVRCFDSAFFSFFYGQSVLQKILVRTAPVAFQAGDRAGEPSAGLEQAGGQSRRKGGGPVGIGKTPQPG